MGQMAYKCYIFIMFTGTDRDNPGTNPGKKIMQCQEMFCSGGISWSKDIKSIFEMTKVDKKLFGRNCPAIPMAYPISPNPLSSLGALVEVSVIVDS